jgi:MFS family permease
MLKDRNILLVVVARFVSRLGGTAAFFIGVWGTAAYTFEATPTQFAWMAGGASVAAIIGSLVAGALIDRFGPRRVLIAAEILTIPAVIALMLADTFVAFALFNACFALVGVPTFTAGASFAPYLVHERMKLEKVNALIEGVGSLAFILGPAVGAAVASVWEPRAVFVVMAVASVIAIAFAYFIRIDETRRSSKGSSAWRELTEGLRVSYATPSLRYYILTGTAIWFGFGAFAALEPLFYRDAVGVGVEWIGYMNTLFGVGLVAGAATLPRLPQKVVSARGLAIMTTLVGLGTVLYVGSTNLWLIAVGATIWGFLVGATEPLLRTLIHLDSPHEYVGRIMGTAQYHRNAGELVPLAVAPGLAAIFGVQSVLIGGGVLVALAALAGFGVARRIDAEAIAHPEAPLFATATEEPVVLPAG